MAHDDNKDSHDVAVNPDVLWKRFLTAFTTATNASRSFYMFTMRLAYLKRHGFPENNEGCRGVSRTIDETAWNGVRAGPL